MISILIPSYNEPNVFDMVEETEKQLEGFGEAQIIVMNDRYGLGKGWALRECLSQAKGDIICLIDGDMDIHPRMINRLIPFLDDYDIVVGKKNISGLLSRKIITFLSRFYIKTFFGINVDSQTGIKLFKRSFLPYWKTNSFAFDIEILSKAAKSGAKIIEVPVEANITKRAKLSSIFKCFVESIKIRGEIMAKNNYPGRSKITAKYCDKMIKRHETNAENFKNEMYECNRVYDFNFDNICKSEKNSDSHKKLRYIEIVLNEKHENIRKKIKEAKDLAEYYKNHKNKKINLLCKSK